MPWSYFPGWLPAVLEGLQQKALPDIPQIRDRSPGGSTAVPCQGITPCRATSLFLEMFVLPCVWPLSLLKCCHSLWGCHCDNPSSHADRPSRLPVWAVAPVFLSFHCPLYLRAGDSRKETLHTHQFNNLLEYGVDSAWAALQICL